MKLWKKLSGKTFKWKFSSISGLQNWMQSETTDESIETRMNQSRQG